MENTKSLKSAGARRWPVEPDSIGAWSEQDPLMKAVLLAGGQPNLTGCHRDPHLLRCVYQRLKRALQRESGKARAGRPEYCLNRHIELRDACRALEKFLHISPQCRRKVRA